MSAPIILRVLLVKMLRAKRAEDNRSVLLVPCFSVADLRLGDQEAERVAVVVLEGEIEGAAFVGGEVEALGKGPGQEEAGAEDDGERRARRDKISTGQQVGKNCILSMTLMVRDILCFCDGSYEWST